MGSFYDILVSFCSRASEQFSNVGHLCPLRECLGLGVSAEASLVRSYIPAAVPRLGEWLLSPDTSLTTYRIATVNL